MINKVIVISSKIVLAYLLADFTTGIYHWIKDTYFSPHTPIIGKVIWNSRLHHIKPRMVIEESNVSLFLNSGLWTIVWMMPFFFYFKINAFILTYFITVSLNDVIHKYAHMTNNERPVWATLLQKMYLIQSYDEHHLHHISPHDVNYCPITPHINTVLEKINFWRKMEYVIEKITKYPPRFKEDKFCEDARYYNGIRFIE